MNVAFSVGDKSKIITNTLKKSADNVDFYSYSTIQEMVKESLARHIAFSRIIFSTQILNSVNPESDLRELNDFIKNYSNSTEIVMIMTTRDKSGIDKVFLSMFNSPMYTPIILDKATAQNLLQVVNDDITKLKTQYYVLDVHQDRTIVSGTSKGTTEEASVKSTEVPEPEKKRGLFGIFKGGKNKNSVQNPDPVPAVENTVQDVSNIAESVPENDNHFSAGPVSIDAGFGGENDVTGDRSEKENEKNSVDSENFRPSGEYENSGVDFSGSADEDNDLSIGDYGEQHTDTGFLDDEEAEELKQLMQEPEETPESEVEGVEDARRETDSWGIQENPEPVREYGVQRESSPVEEYDEKVNSKPSNSRKGIVSRPGRPNIDMIVGVKGSGVTSAIVSEARSLVRDEGIRVLLIDLDTRENGLLSYIDTERFYMDGANRGIDKLRVYEENNIGVISNGYGVPVNSKSLLSLLNSRILNGFDMVYVDCPLECMEGVSEEVIRLCNVLVMSDAGRDGLLSTSMALTDRSHVSFGVEKYVMENCRVEFRNDQECSKKDLDWVKRVCLFANGSWLNRIGM